MNAKSILLLLLSLATAACAASAPTEPNDTTPEPTFQMNSDVMAWTIETDVDGKSGTYRDPGSIRPTYMARIILRRVDRSRMISSGEQALALAKGSPLAQQLSQAQKEFLAEGFGARVDTSAANIPNHYSVNFYAVSEEDARIMTRALMDKFAANARRSIGFEKEELTKRQERLKQNQAALPEKEKQLEQVQKDYEAAKSSTYPLNSKEEAAQLAKELVLQMDRQAKTLDIDRAEVRGKLRVIDEYLAKPDLGNNVIETLETQKIELLIELSGLEARRQAIRNFRDEQQRFCTLFHAREELAGAVGQLKDTLKRDEEVIRGITWRLENPPDYMQPPKVYQNKVIIYPIEAADAQN